MKREEPTLTQQQQQVTNISDAEHGMTDEVNCAYVDFTLPQLPAWRSQQAALIHTVKLLFFKGEIRRVFCHHFDKGLCTSKLNNTTGKKCIMTEDD